MTRRQRLAIRMPVGSTVECLDASDPIAMLGAMRDGKGKAGRRPGPGGRLVVGKRYVIASHEPDVECPLIRLRGFGNHVFFAPSRFARVSNG